MSCEGGDKIKSHLLLSWLATYSSTHCQTARILHVGDFAMVAALTDQASHRSALKTFILGTMFGAASRIKEGEGTMKHVRTL